MSVKFFTTFQIDEIDFFLISQADYIIKIGINEELPKDHLLIYKTPNDKLFKSCYQQLFEYFNNQRTKFDIKFKLTGTEFQKKVWKALSKIPYGKTNSYQEIAEKIKNPKAVRAVGMANKNNPLPILIPCHRVIGKNGKLIGYASGIELKEKLLKLEKSNIEKLNNKKPSRRGS